MIIEINCFIWRNTLVNVGTLGLGFIAAFISGLIACTWMITLVKKSKLIYFAIYCLVVGVAAIGYGCFFM